MKLQGKAINVALLEESDVEQLLRLEVNNKDYFQQFTALRQPSFYTYEGQWERVHTALDMIAQDKGYFFLIRLNGGSEQVIGEVILTEVMRHNLQSCWIGYVLDQAHGGKGYMTEAVKLVVDYAFKELDLHRIEAGVMPHNIPSMQVLLKAGFHKEGIARKNVKINNRWEDHQTLAIVREEPEEVAEHG
ncbi:GNAT family N-acetyltransferase [Brevibacillus humidisoli]|uniref:GNAT family N-acetyltransferase n=1 Tax=Brevibacillus humidisoli TaxID=2895522 RepID=UPI001E5D6B98|nr:GNAT family protein [Brevibacillus humidisoli]UFJ41078.1 GNAT family N-acetyltransferase [Brevibacillus humidisoli]